MLRLGFKTKFIAILAASGCSYLIFELRRTRMFFDNILDKKVLDLEKKRPQYIYCEDPEIDEVLKLRMTNERSFKLSAIDLALKYKFKIWRLRYLKKLMSIALCHKCEYRMKAIEILSHCKLTDAQYATLAQMCDARTAVSLARTTHTDIRFFTNRTTKPHPKFTVKELIRELRDLLVELNQIKEHVCMTYFLSTWFPGFQSEKGTFFDIDIGRRVRHSTHYTMETLMKCLSELVHYCGVGSNSAAILQTQGLQIIMDIYNSLEEKDKESCMMEFVKMIQSVSLIPGSRQQLFVTGWIKVLAEWLHHHDRNICVRAAHSLANLDVDDAFRAKYGKELLVLHPLHHMYHVKSYVDVVFIHGLLGGALSTWRQRHLKTDQLSLYDLTKDDSKEQGRIKRRQFKRSDQTADKYIKTVTDLKKEEWEKIGSDFEFVLCDFPTDCETEDDSIFTIHGTDPAINHCIEDEKNGFISTCWPQDWLAHDCPNARILSVDYNTRLSDWQFTCFRYDKHDIEATAEILLHQLVGSGVGDRPVIWVAHSMGGLILKSMLLRASKIKDARMQNFHKKTQAIFFISSPHFGSHIATMFDSTRRIWWPSDEVNDLRVNSSYLLDLHADFKEWAKKNPLKVITFTENRPTELSGLGLKFEFIIVTRAQGDTGIGDVFHLPYDHIRISKPSNRLSFIYNKILQIIKESAESVKI